MTVSEFTQVCRKELEKYYPAPEAITLVRYLLTERLGISLAQLMMKQDDLLSEDQYQQLNSDRVRLNTGEPVQYVLGFTWFSEMKLNVNKDVLIPRPETEELIEFIKDVPLSDDAKILDVCTGSGCIALALKHANISAQVTACDISLEALALAKTNGEQLQLPVEWCWVDVQQNRWENVNGQLYDVIVSNPPYIMDSEMPAMHKNVTAFEPHIALFVPDDDPLLFYRRIAGFALSHLKPGGGLWFEINEKHGDRVASLMSTLQFTDVRIYCDLSGKDRFVYAQFIHLS
ncbi:peptide chain release factor N(5)-glutamine methyltransferase [soil metagenome]